MVNTGRRSRGCDNCRRMKVGCDEARPSCGRCVRTHRACTGYIDDGPIFRSMNKSLEPKVPSRESENNRHQRDDSVVPVSRDSRYNRWLSRYLSVAITRVPRVISTDWTDQCIAAFFNQFAESPDYLHSTYGSFEYLPELYSKSSSVLLPEAVKAASLTYVANVSSIQHFNSLAFRSYGKALADLGNAMHDSTRLHQDDTLAGINVLSAYEGLAGLQPLGELFHAHGIGQSTVLKMRDDKDNSSHWGKNLVAMTNRGLIWRDIADRSRPHLGLESWPNGLHPSPLSEASARLSVRVAEIRGRMVEELKVDPALRDMAWHLRIEEDAREAVQIQHEIYDCIASTPQDWRPTSIPQPFSNPPAIQGALPFVDRWNPSPLNSTSNSSKSSQSTPEELEIIEDVPFGSTYPSRIDTYVTQNVAGLWNIVRMDQIHLIQAMYDIHLARSQYTPTYDQTFPTMQELRGLMSTTIEDLCASLPFILGDVDETGNLATDRNHKIKPSMEMALLFILLKVCYQRDLEPGLRTWLCSIFERIGRTGGFKIGLVLSRLCSKPFERSPPGQVPAIHQISSKS